MPRIGDTPPALRSLLEPERPAPRLDGPGGNTGEFGEAPAGAPSAPGPVGVHDLDAVKKAVALVNGGKTPAEVEASRRATVRTTEAVLTPPWNGYTWDPAVLDKVMKQTGVADAKAVIRTAIALDQNQRYLDVDRLLTAARTGVGFVTEGFRWSPAALASVMTQTGVAEETAILRMAKRLGDGDRVLSEPELLRAAQILKNIVDANDYVAILERLDALRGRSGLTVEKLGEIEGLPVDAVRFPSATQPPALRVWVSGGVHGDEPCGAASALLLIEQLAANPAMRGDIEWTVVPVVNPRGLVNGTRQTLEQIDLNREFEEDPLDPAEVNLVQAAMKRHPVDLCLDLHSGAASRNGFWVLHQDSADVVGPAMKRFAREWPVLSGRVETYTMEAPGQATSDNVGTLKSLAVENGARWSVTVEAPGSLAYREQVLGQNDVVHQIVLQARAAR